MINEERIRELVEQHIQGTDIFLVDVAVKAGNAIRIHVDTPEGISIDACVQISRFLNEELDRDVEDYALEVSSPGLGSPFRVKQQYEKNLGRTIDVLFTDGTRTTGKLEAVSDDEVVLQVKGDTQTIIMEEIKTAKAIISFN
jgi:ribosome maturation factor RimP